LKSVKLPGIATTLEKKKNKKPKPVPLSAVHVNYTHQKQLDKAYESIDISRISGTRSATRDFRSPGNYKAQELRRLAKNIGISNSTRAKKQLSEMILERVTGLGSSDRK
jgi:hypothetical protein